MQLIYESWHNRGHTVAKVTSAEFEAWLDWNGSRCGDDVDVSCCLQLVTDSFHAKASPTRVPSGKSISIGQRIQGGSFAKEHMLKYTPQEGDNMALYFKLLLANLPLDRVEHVWRPSKNAHFA